MCATCGCDGAGAVVHAHDGHVHAHASADTRTVVLQQKILAKNDGLAERNRVFLAERGVVMVNLMSSPGSGKTTLLERTARELAGRLRIGVIEGDQETSLDAGRIGAAGCAVVQVNTGTGCHLDAEMVGAALRELDPVPGSVVVVENVGNLVCPALFDLGEARRIVLASVPEGEDKPAKYPHMFRQADLVLVSKVDLLPYLRFDLGRYQTDLARIAPAARVMKISAESGEGLTGWYDWLAGALPWPGAGDRGHHGLAQADAAVVAGDP
ncbi:MAG TPA: hydrogenase nickel incorporation protein HypB [Streptosporangiaceae bacterium]|nr:hydrogenase nickel incorporation protein HypB [Streptosporangiaceae bacterium]